ncbi:MAG: B12-binding domain-containing radical SAM protein [Myxococcales bacterium]|nr:B12-binding domain-containing radical SAM protein [Myxococcales bacterium]
MRVLLFNPQTRHAAEMPVSTAYVHVSFLPPLGLLYLAASLRSAGHDVLFIDANAPDHGAKKIAERIREFRPQIACLTAYTFLFYDVLFSARLIKSIQPDTKIALGGPHIDLYPEETLSHHEIDFLISGDGEFPILNLCEALAGKRSFAEVEGLIYRDERNESVFVAPLPRLANIDRYAFPDRSPVRYRYYHCAVNPQGMETSMITSRGCPYLCRYCGDLAEKGYRARSPENVVAEFEQIAAQGFGGVHLWDGTFNVDLERAKEICRRLADRKLPLQFSTRIRGDNTDEEFFGLLAAAGCNRVNIGVESANPEILQAMDRRIDLDKVIQAVAQAKRHGLCTQAYFMLGFPHETEQQIRRTIDFALQLRSNYAMFMPVMLYPGTRLFQDALSNGAMKKDPYREYTLAPTPHFQVRIWETEVPLTRLVHHLKSAYRRFYFTPGHLWREVSGLRSYREFKAKSALGRQLLSYELGKTWHR